jgi:hypothetical protein
METKDEAKGVSRTAAKDAKETFNSGSDSGLLAFLCELGDFARNMLVVLS